MIAAPLLAALLATAPAVAMEPADAGTSVRSSDPADEVVTLSLRDADITKVLEKFAIILGVTPIIAPGVSGTVTIDATASIREHLRDLERNSHLTIRIADGRMNVSRSAVPTPPLDDEAADARYLADQTLPRKPTSARPKPFDGAAEIRTTTGEVLTYSLATPGRISVPGCKSGLSIVSLPGDRFDGLPVLVLMGDAILPRVLSPTRDEWTSGELPACPGPLSIRLSASSARAASAAPLPSFGIFRLSLQIIEVSGEAENVLSAPRVQVAGGEAATIQSGSNRRSPAGATLGQTIQAAIVVVGASETTATVAVSASVLRDVDQKDGGGLSTIRIVHARESGRLDFGKSQRIVLAPTYGRGDSALVMDIVVERVPAKR
jgi:hypothetical protein